MSSARLGDKKMSWGERVRGHRADSLVDNLVAKVGEAFGIRRGGGGDGGNHQVGEMGVADRQLVLCRC